MLRMEAAIAPLLPIDCAANAPGFEFGEGWLTSAPGEPRLPAVRWISARGLAVPVLTPTLSEHCSQPRPCVPPSIALRPRGCAAFATEGHLRSLPLRSPLRGGCFAGFGADYVWEGIAAGC